MMGKSALRDAMDEDLSLPIGSALGKLELSTEMDDSSSWLISSVFKDVFHGGGDVARKLGILLCSAIKKRYEYSTRYI